MGDLVLLLRLEAVHFAVDADSGLAIGGVDEAEHLAGTLGHPLLPIVDGVLILDRQVGLMGAAVPVPVGARSICARDQRR